MLKSAVDNHSKMKRKVYERELRKLQVDLCHLQEWVRHKGARIIVLFEGRDAAGKGGTIKAITERVSPRVFRVVALPAPSDREKTQMFAQRYIPHFPAAGEVVIFDRSWYNRAGVEYVMGFCTEDEHQHFLALCPVIEKIIVDGGITLIKFWLEVGKEEQEKRFQERLHDPRKKWKYSKADPKERKHWDDYVTAYEAVLSRCSTEVAPWFIIPSDHKWFRNLAISRIIVETLEGFHMHYPKSPHPS